jgi:hypothetical protein
LLSEAVEIITIVFEGYCELSDGGRGFSAGEFARVPAFGFRGAEWTDSPFLSGLIFEK